MRLGRLARRRRRWWVLSDAALLPHSPRCRQTAACSCLAQDLSVRRKPAAAQASARPLASPLSTDAQTSPLPSRLMTDAQTSPLPSRVSAAAQTTAAPSRVSTGAQTSPLPSRVSAAAQTRTAAPSRVSTGAQTWPLPSRPSTDAQTSPAPAPSRVRLATAALVSLLMMVLLSLALNPGDASSASLPAAAPVAPCHQLSKQMDALPPFLRDGVAPRLAVVVSIGTGRQDEFADPIAAALRAAEPYSPTAKAAARMWRRNGLNSASVHRDVERYMTSHEPDVSYIRLQPGLDIELAMDEINMTAIVRALPRPCIPLLTLHSMSSQSSLS